MHLSMESSSFKIKAVIFTLLQRLNPSVGCTQVNRINNTGLLVSVHHSNEIEAANFEIFDVTKRGGSKKMYSFEEVHSERFGIYSLQKNRLFTTENMLLNLIIALRSWNHNCH